jgi:hypothetical protein
VEQLQFELGEGPHFEVWRTGRPVFIADVRASDHSKWPVFAVSLQEFDVRALFAFPLTLGAVTVGVVGLYRLTAGPLSPGDLALAESLTAASVVPAVRIAMRNAQDEELAGRQEVPELRREVLQATGMILAQLDITATEAFARLRAQAFSTGESVQKIASDVVMRRLDFRELGE